MWVAMRVSPAHVTYFTSLFLALFGVIPDHVPLLSALSNRYTSAILFSPRLNIISQF